MTEAHQVAHWARAKTERERERERGKDREIERERERERESLGEKLCASIMKKKPANDRHKGDRIKRHDN